MTPRPRRRAGFTLIELLVAISILAIVAVLGWRGLDSIVRARIALTAQIEATRGMQLAFAQMQSDAEHIASQAMLQNRPNLLAEAQGMTLVRNVYDENEPTRLQVISYRVRDGQLERRESLPTRDLIQLDVMWKAATSNTDATPGVILQAGVTAITVQTWENRKWVPAGAAATAPVAQMAAGAALVQNLPPSGLQVALQLKDAQALMVKTFLLGGA
jgi:general secretion pathway protein J